MTRHIHVLLPTRKNVWARVVAKLEDTHRRRTMRANAAEMKAWADISIEAAADIWLVD